MPFEIVIQLKKFICFFSPTAFLFLVVAGRNAVCGTVHNYLYGAPYYLAVNYTATRACEGMLEVESAMQLCGYMLLRFENGTSACSDTSTTTAYTLDYYYDYHGVWKQVR